MYSVSEGTWLCLGTRILAKLAFQAGCIFGGEGNLLLTSHSFERGGAIWRTNLALRDYLRTNSGAAREYAAAKRSALESGVGSLLAYSVPVVDRLLKQALAVA